MKSPVEWDDVQGLVRFGYKHLTEAEFVLLTVKDRDAALDWLAAAPITSAVVATPRPTKALQVALSSDGLRAIGLREDILAGFSAEFLAGMAGDDNRSRRLGDTGSSGPDSWRWGGPSRNPHVLLMIYAQNDTMSTWCEEIVGSTQAGFEILERLETSTMDGKEPFGFADGLSEPELDWERRRPVEDQEVNQYSNLSCLGEFLLGYPNEYGMYTDRPLLEPEGDARSLPRAEDHTDWADLGRNGSYLVFRQLDQDVTGFWQYLDREAGGDAGRRQSLGECMVGRTMEGKPLIKNREGLNDFDYDGDPRGLACPFGAHIRRVNPRNSDLPSGSGGLFGWLRRTLGFDAVARGKDLVASTRFHRLLRRGRKYGLQLSMEEAVQGAPGSGGLHFICLNANIARQFEFVQAAWITGTRFDGLNRESDPLLGSRTPDLNGVSTDGFSIPQAYGPNQKLSQLPRFVQVIGGAYFFLPGIRALRYLAKAT